MPQERKPTQVVPKTHIPSGFVGYKVTNVDSWTSIANRHGMEVWELIYENFRTRDTAETNWYLKNYVGCTNITSDGDNYYFSSNDNPGIIYVPAQVIHVPEQHNKQAGPELLKRTWAGIAKVHSGDLFVLGAYDITGMIYNLGDELPDVKNAMININGYKMGPGLGASVGAAFVIAHGYENAAGFRGDTGGWDFDLAIVAKLGDFFKGVKGLGTTIDSIQKYKKMRYLTENAIKNLSITQPGVYTIPIPLSGVGLHAWAGFKFGEVDIFRTGKGIY